MERLVDKDVAVHLVPNTEGWLCPDHRVLRRPEVALLEVNLFKYKNNFLAII